jgi:hypothetical protein
MRAPDPRHPRRLKRQGEKGEGKGNDQGDDHARFHLDPAPVHTLWDTPDTAIQRLPGIWWVTTPSHGGFVLSDERQAAMPEALRLDSIYYEEDVNWSLVIVGLEAEFAALKDLLFDIERDLAHQTARHW